MPVMTNDDMIGTSADYGTLARMELDFANKHMGVFGVDYSPKVLAALCNAILALEFERNALLDSVATLRGANHELASSLERCHDARRRLEKNG